ncbi:MAG: hypothetical protein CMG57_03490 [Candidatus Marinimicrobia bacterium]|nr:hypothetical protein [Candidatus Neomarinimicrobiota bacterium]|tara:strand:- start:746 stop:1162 length:417 start_codon:yes stop_codon:yes gene_type:complete
MRIFLLVLISGICFAKTKFTDRQIASMVPKYFARDHYSPTLNRTKIYGEGGKKIILLEIQVNRNRYDGQMEYALSAMASICSYAKKPFDTFVLVMQSDNPHLETEQVDAKAKCTIDYFVFKRVKHERWIEKCISLSKL